MTPFEDIYCLSNLMCDNGMTKRLTPNNFYQYMFKCLQFAVGEFERKCYESLTFEQKFFQMEFDFITDGKEKTFQIPLHEYNVDVFDYMKKNYIKGEFNIYIGCRQSDEDSYIEVTDFEYESSDIYNPAITLPTIPDCNWEFYIVFYKIGSFKETLSQKVKNLLAIGMEVPYLNEKLTKESLLEQKVYSNSVNSFSQAQHITALRNVYESVCYKNFKSEIENYTYDYADSFYDLGGGRNGYVGDTLWH